MSDERNQPEARPRRRGRPPGTTARELELIALELFADHGFDDTTVEEIATRANVSTRTFFRYFDSKASVLWHAFDDDVAELRAAFADVPDELAMMDAIRAVVVEVNRYRAEDLAELRTRVHLIASVPALRAGAEPHYDAWSRAVTDFAAARLGLPPESLIPQAVGRACLGACNAAFDAWADSRVAVLTESLDLVLSALAGGFTEDEIQRSPTVGG